MKIRRCGKLVLAFVLAASLLLVIVFIFVARWIDSRVIPDIHNGRMFVRVIDAIYSISPKIDKEKSVSRSLKLAHLVALSDYGLKSTAVLARDMVRGYEILNNAIDNVDKKNEVAIVELSTERLMFLNRIIALSAIFNKEVPDTGDANDLGGLIYVINDPQVKRVASREIGLHEILMGRGIKKSDQVFLDNEVKIFSVEDAIDSLDVGLAMCVMGRSGAERISEAHRYLSDRKISVIYSVVRNIDAPLIAAAEIKAKNPSCRESVLGLKDLLGGN